LFSEKKLFPWFQVGKMKFHHCCPLLEKNSFDAHHNILYCLTFTKLWNYNTSYLVVYLALSLKTVVAKVRWLNVIGFFSVFVQSSGVS